MIYHYVTPVSRVCLLPDCAVNTSPGDQVPRLLLIERLLPHYGHQA